MVGDKELLNIYKQYQRIYPELKEVKLILNKSCRIDGCEGICHIELIGNYITEGKRRYRLTKVHKIELNQDISEKRKKFALLHEMAHAITPVYERKIKDEWIIPHGGHDHEFYQSFLKNNKLCI